MRARKRFIQDLGIMKSPKGFSIGVYKFSTPGCLSDWVAVIKIASGTNDQSRCVQEVIAAASQQAPIFLSQRETCDFIASIRSQTGINKKHAAGILQTLMPDGTYPIYGNQKSSIEKQLYSDIAHLIRKGDKFDDTEELNMISDMRQLNCRGNTDISKFEIFWKGAMQAMEIESSHGAHEKRHAAGDSNTTNRVSHAPFISTNHLIKCTITLLEKDGLKQNLDFKVPCKGWVEMQFTSSNEQKKTAEQYTGRLPFICVLQTCDLRNEHPHGHYNAKLKQIWQANMAALHLLLEQANNLSVSPEDREFVHEPIKAIAVFGQDDKAKAPVGRNVAVCATRSQSLRAIVKDGDIPSAADHDWHSENIIPSVTLRMNISNNAGNSLYSGGKDGSGCIYVSLHDATFDPSNCLKHSANLFRVLRSSLDDTSSSCPFYSVGLETDGGGDHNHKYV